VLDFFSDNSYWAWLILGVVLAGLEMFAPGIFFIWVAVAALATGILDAVVDFSWQWAILTFTVLSVISVFVGRTLDVRLREQHNLNEGAERYIGQVFVLLEDTKNGASRVQINDSSWRVQCREYYNKGTSVRVTGVAADGTTLIVEGAY
jgi:membrane protein implicated in regulation of membrane protease activity